MNSYKKFTIIFIAIAICFVAFNYFIWTFYTKSFFPEPNDLEHLGDLSRLSYTKVLAEARILENNLPLKHIEFKDYRHQKVDVLTIGDSFSNDGSGGLNPFYQDYIATINGLSVLNIKPYKDKNYLETIAVLLNSGYLDLIKPKWIIVESVERSSVIRFSVSNINFSQKESLNDLETFYRSAECHSQAIPNPGFINNGNFKFIFNNILYLFSDNAFGSVVYLRNLKQPMFTVGKGRKILFYTEDLSSIPSATDKNIYVMNQNFNILATMLTEKGIKLYFMPAVDKYDLYSDFIVDNPYPQSKFFEKLRQYKKNYYFIDTKAILYAALKNREKDIFYADDTHWTWKASNKIFQQIRFKF